MQRLVIRLKRKGSWKAPKFDIVVVCQKKRYSFFLDRLGYVSSSKAEMFVLNFFRLGFWLNKGAIIKPSVKKHIVKIVH